MSGVLKSGATSKTPRNVHGTVYNKGLGWTDKPREASEGGASRFFYCAKASRRERGAGLEGLVKMRGDLTDEQREYVMQELIAAGVET